MRGAGPPEEWGSKHSSSCPPMNVRAGGSIGVGIGAGGMAGGASLFSPVAVARPVSPALCPLKARPSRFSARVDLIWAWSHVYGCGRSYIIFAAGQQEETVVVNNSPQKR